MYDPQYSSADLSQANLLRDRDVTQNSEISAAFFQDRITVAERWHLLAGARHTESAQSRKTVDRPNGGVDKAEISQSDWTTQFGLVYDVTDTTSLFASRSESFVPQQGTTSGKRPLDAEESTQYEGGIRFFLGDLKVDIAGFVIANANRLHI